MVALRISWPKLQENMKAASKTLCPKEFLKQLRDLRCDKGQESLRK